MKLFLVLANLMIVGVCISAFYIPTPTEFQFYILKDVLGLGVAYNITYLTQLEFYMLDNFSSIIFTIVFCIIYFF